MSHPRRLSLVAVVAVMSFSPLAAAQSADKSAAVALYDEAERLASAGSFKEACPKYAESNRLDPQLGALMHLADCYEKAAQLASAWASFRDAAEIAGTRGDPRVDIATSRAAALEPRLSRLAVVVPPEAAAPGLEVKRDGVIVSSGMWGSSIPVDIGEHVVEATAAGKVAWKGTVTVTAEGSNDSISVPVLADVAKPAEAAPKGAVSDTVPAAETGGFRSMQRVLGWSAVGAGAVGLGVGVLFELKKSSKVSDRDAICPTGKGCTVAEAASISDLTDQARGAATIGMVGLVAGSVLAAGGLALVFTAPHQEQSVAVAPIVGPSFQGLMVRSAVW